MAVRGRAMDSFAINRYLAEFLGTAALVFFAVGSAVFGIGQIGALGVALAFGLVLLGLAYAIGPISGCHINPAVTLGMLVGRRITPVEAGAYMVAQVIGGIAGYGLIKLIVSVGDVRMEVPGTNMYGVRINAGGAFILEMILTFLLVFVVLMVTRRNDVYGFDGMAIGLTLALIHLVGIPLTGTSVNPARSIGPALFQGGEALSQLWLFIVAPLAGGIIAAAVEMVVRPVPQPTPNEVPVS